MWFARILYHIRVGNDTKQHVKELYEYLKLYTVYPQPYSHSRAPPIEVSLFLNSRFQLGS